MRSIKLSCFILIGCIGFVFIAYRLYIKLKALEPVSFNCSYCSDTPYTYSTDCYQAPSKIEWCQPIAQSEDGLFVYGLFNPPCLAYDRAKGMFSAYPIYFRPIEAKNLSFRLLNFQQKSYPLIFEGYYEGALQAEYTFLLYDRDTKHAFKLALGEHSHKDFALLAFHRKRWNEAEQAFSDPILSVFDKRYGRVFDLRLKEVLGLDSFDIALSLEEGKVLNFSCVGDVLHLGTSSLCLRAVYIEHNTILLEQKHSETAYSDYFYLSLCNL
jgi:hypothetical protein